MAMGDGDVGAQSEELQEGGGRSPVSGSIRAILYGLAIVLMIGVGLAYCVHYKDRWPTILSLCRGTRCGPVWEKVAACGRLPKTSGEWTCSQCAFPVILNQ